MSWHADPTTLARYLAGQLADAPASSVEAHLMGCADCRGALAKAAPAPARRTHERSWDALVVASDADAGTPVERLLSRWLPADVVRLVAAAPALRQAWWSAGIGLLVLALVAAHLGTGAVGTALFVVSAPLLPLAGVALAYGASDELAGEVALTTPYSRFRLLLLRTAAVAATTLPVTAALAVALPVDVELAALWLVPAVALCSLTLALSASWDTRWVAAVLGGVWLAVSWASLRPTRAPLSIDELLARSIVFRPTGQAALLLVAALAVAVAVIRRPQFENRSPT